MLLFGWCAALFSLSSASLLADLNGTVWSTSFGGLRFDIGSRACEAADGWYDYTLTSLIEDLVEHSDGTLRGRWSETTNGLCANRLPSGRNDYGEFIMRFSETLENFEGAYGRCDEAPTNSRAWDGERDGGQADPVTQDMCPEQYGGATPVPAITPTPSSTPPPLDFTRKRAGPKISVGLAGRRNPDGSYALKPAINVGRVAGFPSEGRLLRSEDAYGIAYALLQIVVVIIVGELLAVCAKVSAGQSLVLSSWNRIRGYDSALGPITSLVHGLPELLRKKSKSPEETCVMSRNAVLGIALGLLVLGLDLGLLVGSRYTSRVYSKDDLFSPAVVLNEPTGARVIAPPPIVEIPLVSDALGLAFTRNLWLTSSLARDAGIASDRVSISLSAPVEGSSLSLSVNQDAQDWRYSVSFSWRSSREEGVIQPPLTFGPNALFVLETWVRGFAILSGFQALNVSSGASDEVIVASVELNVSFDDPAEFQSYCGQHLLGSLSLTNEPLEDVPYGAVVLSELGRRPRLAQKDFAIAIGQRPQMSAKVLAFVALASTVATLVVVVLLRGKQGDCVAPLVRRHFGIEPDTRLWKVGCEAEYTTPADKLTLPCFEEESSFEMASSESRNDKSHGRSSDCGLEEEAEVEATETGVPKTIEGESHTP
mmetsp:Transcript_18450/g.45410  ORF Transcript_18450/g.45410 Transcript_18450/m.45410 type:complete len:653 (+) Transcript_18450:90-2048(+)